MFNLLSSAPSKATSTVVEAAQAGGDSPLAAGENGVSGEGRTTRAGKLFANLFAAALGERGKVRLAGAAGNDLPMPDLQMQELGSGMKLLTPADSELPQEDALFAFAVGQGLDAALVASVLWPAGATQEPGQVPAGGSGSTSDSAAVVAALLAGIASGQVSAADGARAGASLIMAMGGEATGVAAVGATQAGLALGAQPAGFAIDAEVGPSVSFQAMMAVAGGPAAQAAAEVVGQDLASRLAGMPQVASGAAADSAMGLTSGPQGADRAALQAAVAATTGQTLKAAAGDSFKLAAMGSGAGDASGSGPLEASIGPLRTLATDIGVTGLLSGRGGEASLARAVGAMPAQWVLGPNVERQLSNSRPDAERGSSAADDTAIAAGEGAGEGRHDSALGSHHRSTGAVPRDGVLRDALDLSQDVVGASKEGGDDSELARLSRKVSEGIAQRMAAALASDSWKVRLDLKPAHLGQISIDMSMAQGQIEAVFDATNPAARALIADGLDRLRQDLQRSGMNVAFLSMNSGSSGGHAGKSTSQRRDDAVSGPGVAEIEGLQGGSLMRASKTVDGLDILV